MKQSEFAALHGVSRKTVTTWKKRGWLVFSGDEVDVEASNALLKKYRRDGAETVTQRETLINEPVVRITDEAGCNFQIDVGI
ncbi:hypothetical protein C6T62_00135, partial [Burkholderia multivorans]